MSAQAPASKRRRIDAANATLRKPFKSPLLNRAGGQPGGAAGLNEGASSPAPAGRLSAAATSTTDKSPASPAITVRPRVPPVADRQRHSTAKGGGGANNGSDSDELLDLVLRRKKELEVESRELDRQLGVVREAERIEAASLRRRPGEAIDAELRELAEKWKGASRLAAEELFVMMKDRVASTGGIKAWRKSQKRQKDYFWGTDDGNDSEGRRQREGDSLEGENSGTEETEDQRHRYEDEKAEGADEVESEDDEEQEYTILVMLRSLNIEPGLLGYSEVEGAEEIGKAEAVR